MERSAGISAPLPQNITPALLHAPRRGNDPETVGKAFDPMALRSAQYRAWLRPPQS